MFENSNPVGYTIGFMAIIFFCIVVIVIAALEIFHAETIKTDTLIKPEIRLKVRDNKIDTVYVYKEPKWFNKLNEER